MELDPHYASVVLARWESFSGETATCLIDEVKSEKAIAGGDRQKGE